MPAEELDFVNLVLLLGSTANLELGQKNDKGQSKEKDLPRARGIVNMLKALQVKTEGRRNPQEDLILGSVLKDLQDKYVQATGLKDVEQAMASWAAQQYSKNQKP